MLRKSFLFLVIVFLFAFNGQAYCQTSFAILPMEVRGDVKPEKVEEASSSLYQVLINSKKYNIVDREHVKTVLSEQSFQISGVTNKQDAVKLGKLLNVDKFIATSIYMKSADQFAINLRVIDVTTGQSEFYKEISNAKYSAKDHGRFCAAEIIAEYQLIGIIEGIVGDVIIVSLGEKHGLNAGDRLFVARKEILKSNTGEILFQEIKRLGTLTVISMDSSRAKTKIKILVNSGEKLIKSDIVSTEPLPKKETLISDVPLLTDVEKGKLILDDDMENKKYLSVSNGKGESYKNGQLHINSLERKSGHAYCFYPQPFTQMDNIIFEGNIEFQETQNKYNKADVVFRSNKEYGDNASSYSFFFNNDGSYEVIFLIKGKNYPIIKLQSTPFLNRGAVKNKFQIVAYGSKFDFYLNDNFVIGLEHEHLEKGTIGFKALHGSYITVDNVKAWEAVKK